MTAVMVTAKISCPDIRNQCDLHDLDIRDQEPGLAIRESPVQTPPCRKTESSLRTRATLFAYVFRQRLIHARLPAWPAGAKESEDFRIKANRHRFFVHGALGPP